MTRDFRQHRFLSEINVVPLVDVVLVLLVIFMVTAPMLHRGLDLTLPRSQASTISPDERIMVTIASDERIFLGGDRVTMTSLQQWLRQAHARNPAMSVYLRADRRVPYGRIIQVMDAVKGVGIERLGMVTNPKATVVEEERLTPR